MPSLHPSGRLGRTLPAFTGFAGHERVAAATHYFETRVELWRSLLAYPPVVAAVCERAREALLPELCPEAALRRLQVAAAPLARPDAPACRTAFEAARRAAAEALVAADPDQCDQWLPRRILAELVERVPTAEPRLGRWAAGVRRRQAALGAAMNLLRARDELVGRLARAMQTPGRSLAELIAAGGLGLRLAAGRFDPRRGVRFVACAEWWIRRMIRRTLADPPTSELRPPASLRAAYSEFIALHGRPPTEDELLTLTGAPPEQIRQVRAAWTHRPLPGRREASHLGGTLPRGAGETIASPARDMRKDSDDVE